MSEMRPPASSRKPYLTPIPGSRVSRRSIGIAGLPPFECRCWEQSASEAFRFLHQDDAERRRDQDVEPRERHQLRLLCVGNGRVLGGQLRQDDRELSMCYERDAGIEALP